MDTALETLDTIDGLLLSNIVEAEAEGTDQQDINLNIWKTIYVIFGNAHMPIMPLRRKIG